MTTYFPIKCFSLIKEYADINEAKYHQKKVAQLVKDHIEFCRVKYNNREECFPLVYEYSDRNPCFPLVYEIQYVEELLEQHNETLIIYGEMGSVFYRGLDLSSVVATVDEQMFQQLMTTEDETVENLEDELFNLKHHQRWVLYLN